MCILEIRSVLELLIARPTFPSSFPCKTPFAKLPERARSTSFSFFKSSRPEAANCQLPPSLSEIHAAVFLNVLPTSSQDEIGHTWTAFAEPTRIAQLFFLPRIATISRGKHSVLQATALRDRNRSNDGA